MGITDEENEAIIEFDRLQLLELESFASEQIERGIKGETIYFSFQEPTPVIYTFVPQSDITAFELALCVPIMQYGTAYEGHVMELPEFVRRHFVKRGEQ